uniref:Uncharacterized protein n=1 Tax=Oryza brachyantha TaxID=4533 RepID=J3LBL6_ORYBR
DDTHHTSYVYLPTSHSTHVAVVIFPECLSFPSFRVAPSSPIPPNHLFHCTLNTNTEPQPPTAIPLSKRLPIFLSPKSISNSLAIPLSKLKNSQQSRKTRSNSLSIWMAKPSRWPNE